MESNNQIKRIKTTAIVLIVLGGLMVLSNLPALIFMNVSENFNAETPYVHPIYFVLNGVLLLSSGLLLRTTKKVGFNLTLFSALTTVVLIAVHSILFTSTMTGELKTIGTIGSLFFILIFLVPAILMTRFLFKRDIKKLFN